KTAMTKVITNPILAANIFGALSVGRLLSCSICTTAVLVILSGLNFELPKARMKKSAISNNGNHAVLEKKPTATSNIVNNALNRVRRSFTFSVDMGQTNCFIQYSFNDK